MKHIILLFLTLFLCCSCCDWEIVNPEYPQVRFVYVTTPHYYRGPQHRFHYHRFHYVPPRQYEYRRH